MLPNLYEALKVTVQTDLQLNLLQAAGLDWKLLIQQVHQSSSCLLYTSDAADE